MSSYSGKLINISVLDKPDGCPAQNMMAVGGAGRERNENVKSWEECSDCCRKKSDCKYWTWYAPQSACVTMTNARSLKKKKKLWSGSQECGGEILIIIGLFFVNCHKFYQGQRSQVPKSRFILIIFCPKLLLLFFS